MLSLLLSLGVSFLWRKKKGRGAPRGLAGVSWPCVLARGCLVEVDGCVVFVCDDVGVGLEDMSSSVYGLRFFGCCWV